MDDGPRPHPVAGPPVTRRARGRAVFRVTMRLCLLGAIAYGLHLLMDWVSTHDPFADDRVRTGMLVAFLVAYAVLIAVPFVPGLEIGLMLMALEGPSIAPVIYLATVSGLCLAYAAGEWIPYARLHRLFADLHMTGACRLLAAVEPLSRAERIDALRDRTPAWLRPLATRFRYVLLALLVNMPGSSVIGGGGGILFTAGLSRLFLPVPTVIAILCAVAPVPLAVWLFGVDIGGLLD
ncbi:hypothetical protein ACVDG3_00750 [Meridianimarinicoccus sp. RP-17]|uniref:hypothetical protein n=1 Tax=Meridianimarinicoccus zhengii TaxID=2056810 RepID=UPI000DAE0032|nr:hypothetical protein [Phycocomes zhengii]